MARVILDGFDELMRNLETLPVDLAEQSTSLIATAAHRMADTVTAAYPERTGDLRRGMKVEEFRDSPEVVRAVVTNTSPHALWYELGTQTRHTHAGWNRGAMPPAHVFIPAAERERKSLWTAIREVLEAAGLTVTGSAP